MNNEKLEKVISDHTHTNLAGYVGWLFAKKHNGYGRA